MTDELCLCCGRQKQSAVDAMVDDTDYSTKSIIMQFDGMSELMG